MLFISLFVTQLLRSLIFLLSAASLPNCLSSIVGGQWTLVRHVPEFTNGTRLFHPATDGLVGTASYGPQPGTEYDSSPWTIPFSTYTFNNFLFITGNCQKWLLASKTSVGGDLTGVWYSGVARTITKSSINASSYLVVWYNRGAGSAPEDPWVSLEDHSTSISDGTLMYGEASYGPIQNNSLIGTNGLNVYVDGAPPPPLPPSPPPGAEGLLRLFIS